MKKILIVLYYYAPYVSGLTVLAKREAENLAKRGHQITVLCCQHDKSLPTEEIINGVKIVRSPVLFQIGKGVVSPLFWLRAISFSRKYDFVNPHLPLADFGLSSLFIPSKKIVSLYHCDLNLGAGITSRIIEFISYVLMRITLIRSSKIIVTTKDYFGSSRLSRYLNKSIEIYPPIDETLFFSRECEDLKEKWKIEEGTFLIGFVGRIVYEKGIKYLLQTIPLLEQEIQNFKILLAGDYKNIAGGSIKEQFDHYLERYHDKIIFTGFLPDEELRKFYSLIDLLVLPSIDPLEAFGMVQIEAMLSKTPVIASDRPGVRTIIQKTGNGLLAKPKDSEHLAQQIIKIYRNKIEVNLDTLQIYHLNSIVNKYEEAFS